MTLETAGKKAAAFFKFQKIHVEETHMVADQPEYEQIDRIGDRYLSDFLAGEYDSDTVISFDVQVTDGQFTDVDVVDVTVLNNVNEAPVADAGTDQTVGEGVNIYYDWNQFKNR